MRDFDPDLFNIEISQQPWFEQLDLQSVDEMVNEFNFSFMEIVNRHMPFIKKRVYEEQAPWVTNELLSLIDRREYLTNEEHKCPCPYHLNLKNETAKAVNKLILSLKRDYIKNELDKHKHDAKKLWRAIRELWPGTKRNDKTIQCIQGKSDPIEISNILNDHFSTVAEKVHQNLNNDANLDDFPIQIMPPVFEIELASTADVVKAIGRLSNTKSFGIDGITSSMLKNCKYEIAKPLTKIFNMSICSRTFPTLWKKAKITPLYKDGQADIYKL